MYIDRLVERDRAWSAQTGERIVLATRPHWFCAVRRALPGLMLMLLGLVASLFGEQLTRLLATFVPRFPIPLAQPKLNSEAAVVWGSIVVILAGLVVVGRALLERHFTEYAITISFNSGGRIIMVRGILARQTITVPLSMVNDLVLDEPLLGRILGWGNIDIETGNDYRGDRLEYMPNPQLFQQVWKSWLIEVPHERYMYRPSIR